MTAYATSADLLDFVDARTVGDLLSDTGDPVTTVGIASDTTLPVLLQAASGQVEAACGTSDLYTPVQLAALTGNSQSLLKQLVCTLALVALVRRRPEKYGSKHWQNIRKETEEYLDRLRDGQRLFDDPSKREAGLPTIDGPSAMTYQYMNMLPSRVRNYFPSVAQRLPLGRQ